MAEQERGTPRFQAADQREERADVEQVVREAVDAAALARRAAVPAQVAGVDRVSARGEVAGEPIVPATVLAVAVDDCDGGAGRLLRGPAIVEERQAIGGGEPAFVVLDVALPSGARLAAAKSADALIVPGLIAVLRRRLHSHRVR